MNTSLNPFLLILIDILAASIYFFVTSLYKKDKHFLQKQTNKKVYR